MKKILIIVGIFIAFLLIYFLQINFFSWYNIAGIKPNLYIILSLFIRIIYRKKLWTSLWNHHGLLFRSFYGKNNKYKYGNSWVIWIFRRYLS